MHEWFFLGEEERDWTDKRLLCVAMHSWDKVNPFWIIKIKLFPPKFTVVKSYDIPFLLLLRSTHNCVLIPLSFLLMLRLKN